MELTSDIALSRLVAQQRAMDVTATNLANAGTPGFKAERVLFSDWISRQARTDAPRGGGTVAFTQDRATYRDQGAGPVQHTANPFDLAVSGDGYFTVDTPRGPRLTRAGRFQPMPDGRVGDADGNALLGAGGQPIRLSPADTVITITADGAVSSQNGQLGKVGLVKPDDPSRMTAEGGRLFRADGPTSPVPSPHLVQGAVEDSNVQPILETTRMMDGLRQFQFTSQFLQAEADRMQSAIDKITRRAA